MNDAKDLINCSPGRKPWPLLRFPLCRGEDGVDGFDQEYLDMLCFMIEGKICQSASADEISFIHCCCENGSVLSNPVGKTGMIICDITKKSDFTEPNTVCGIMRKLQGSGDVLFYCSPCAGGSTWQRLNLELAKRHGLENMIVK